MVTSSIVHRRTATGALGLLLGAVAVLWSPEAHASAPVQVAARGPAVARIDLAAPERSKLLSGESIALQATAFDAAGNALPSAKLSFRVTPAITGKVTRGVFTAKRGGTAQIVAVNGRVKSNAIQIFVNEVGRIEVTPGGPFEIHAGDTLVFGAQAYDLNNVPLPNEEYPNVPLLWKAPGGAITQQGGLSTRRPGRVTVYAISGRAKSNPVSVIVRRREEASSTRLFLTGQPVAGVQSACVTIERFDVMSRADMQAGSGNWRTVLTGDQIRALVGQPIDVQKLNNLRLQIGTAYLPEGDYLRGRVTFSTQPGANYVIKSDGTRVDLTWSSAEEAVLEIPLYIWVTPGYPCNGVFELLLPRSIVLGEDNSTLFFEPFFEWTPMDDTDLKRPFGSVVGQLQPREDVTLVFASTPDDGYSELRNYFGTYDPETGAFRISSLPAGTYHLGVQLRGQQAPVILTTFRVVAGQDNILPQTFTLP